MTVDFEIKQNQLWFISSGIKTKATAFESYRFINEKIPNQIKIIESLCPIRLRIVNGESSTSSVLRAEVVSRSHAIALVEISKDLEYVCDNNIWMPIEKDSLHEIFELFSEVGINQLGKLTYAQELYLTIQGRRLSPPIEIYTNQKRDFRSSINEPTLLNAKPYPYQVEGYRWLAFLSQASLGGILGDEMGLGKTLQVIMLLESEIQQARIPNLIVCPPSLMENWKREIKRFVGRDALIHHGSQRTFTREKLLGSEIVITSYDAVRRDELILGQISWNLIAADEAQYIKNETSQRHLSVKSLQKRFGVAITGTPIENRLTDLWAISDFVIPGVLGKLDWFMSNFGDDQESASKLRASIGSIILRRRVAEVAKDLPAATLKSVPLEMPASLAWEYRKEVDKKNRAKKDIFSLIIKLRQLCSHLPEGMHNKNIDVHLGKYEYLKDTLGELFANGNKAIIFAPFTNAIKELEGWIKECFPDKQVHVLFGETPIPNRQALVDKFTLDPTSGVLIMNPKAGGVGLNITTANHVIHFSPDWNPAVMDQASARSFRRGQILPVVIHNLFYVDSIEEYMYERLNEKRELSETALLDTDQMPNLDELLLALERVPNA